MIIIAYKIAIHLKFLVNQILNSLKIRMFNHNIRIGVGYKIKGDFCLTVGKNSTIVIGKRLKIYSNSHLNPISKGQGSVICTENFAKLIIGNDVGMSSVCIWVHKKIEIGDNVKIGACTTILDSDCHSLDYRLRRGVDDMKFKKKSNVYIGNDVLIGANCVILKGVTIGDRSIIGAGSVVTKSIPSDEIWAGNPASFVKKIE